MTTETADSRYYYFDFLRVFGAFAVIVLHVAASKWYTTDIHSVCILGIFTCVLGLR